MQDFRVSDLELRSLFEGVGSRFGVQGLMFCKDKDNTEHGERSGKQLLRKAPKST